jgi:AbrB family looped-hinge helix DNA binding protein
MPRAKITSKGQVTIPVGVRDALQLETGDSIALEVHGDYAVMRRVPRLVDVVGDIAEEYPVGEPVYGSMREAIEAHVQRTWNESSDPVAIVRPPKGSS